MYYTIYKENKKENKKDDSQIVNSKYLLNLHAFNIEIQMFQRFYTFMLSHF